MQRRHPTHQMLIPVAAPRKRRKELRRSVRTDSRTESARFPLSFSSARSSPRRTSLHCACRYPSSLPPSCPCLPRESPVYNQNGLDLNTSCDDLSKRTHAQEDDRAMSSPSMQLHSLSTFLRMQQLQPPERDEARDETSEEFLVTMLVGCTCFALRTNAGVLALSFIDCAPFTAVRPFLPSEEIRDEGTILS